MQIKLPCVGLNRYAETRAKSRHPWVFSNELNDPKAFAKIPAGEMVDVLDCHGNYLGTGFVNPKSLIAVRILSRERDQAIDIEFFQKKIESALRLRENIYGRKSLSGGTYRALFGEADGLPGLVIDCFEGAWVVEPHSLGMAMRKEMIIAALAAASKRLEKPENIIFRTDSRSASLEGMEVSSEIVMGEIPASGIWAVEDGIRFPVDPVKGQKTGFFFDQRDNRTFFSQWIAGAVSNGREVYALDAFCHAGAWGLRALKAGAKKATFIDSSASALAGVEAAAKQMGFADKIELIEGDGLESLKKIADGKFNAVALDPPALVPNKKSLPQGFKNYRELNREAVRVTRDGGIMSTSSCSYHLEESRFEEMVHKSLLDLKRDARILHRGGLSSDHPMLPGMSEGRYLKNLVLGF